MQRLKETGDESRVSSLMPVPAGATLDGQLLGAVEGVLEDLLASPGLQVVCVVCIQDNQAPARAHTHTKRYKQHTLI